MWPDDYDDTPADFVDLIDRARLMAWLCLAGFVGFAMWVATQ